MNEQKTLLFLAPVIISLCFLACCTKQEIQDVEDVIENVVENCVDDVLDDKKTEREFI